MSLKSIPQQARRRQQQPVSSERGKMVHQIFRDVSGNTHIQSITKGVWKHLEKRRIKQHPLSPTLVDRCVLVLCRENH